jgi:hypothetical protein
MIAEIIATACTWLTIVAPHLGEAQTVRCTCYIPTGHRTADGTVPYEGIIASNKEHLGDMAILLTMDGDMIGVYECRDIGGGRMLRNGTAIDVYRDNMDRAWEWIHIYGDYVQVIWIEAEG